MKAIGTQFKAWGNVEFPTNKDAMRARNQLAQSFRKAGIKCWSERLTDQLRPYSGLGQPDGTIGHVYMVSVGRDDLQLAHEIFNKFKNKKD